MHLATIILDLSVLNWSGRQDSNLRPLAPHASALPGCATPRPRDRIIAQKGFENLGYVRRQRRLHPPSAAKNLDQLFQFEPHLMNELLALIEIHLRIVAGQTVARAADRKPLFIQQAANLTNDE